MNDKIEQQMKIMVDAVQPYCDEQILAAMTCSHAGSIHSTLIFKLLGNIGSPDSTSTLPNPVFIAVGISTIYAFSYKPRGFKFKIKKEAARWPRKEVNITLKQTGIITAFDLNTVSGEHFELEIPTMMGGGELVERFLETLPS